MARLEKGEGFPGQRIVVLPRAVVAEAREDPLMNGVFPTDVGYFPHVKGHLRRRPAGVAEAIFMYCAKGSGWCEIKTRHHGVRAGDLLVIPPKAPHIYGASAEDPWTLYWFHAQGALLEAYLKGLELTEGSPVGEIGENAHVMALFEEMLEVIEHGYTPLRLLHASHTLAHLIVILIRERRSKHHETAGPSQRVSETISYMKHHLKEPLHLDSLAALANLSRSQYGELFKKETGYAPIDYLIRLRMHRACQLLDTTDWSIKTVASEVGYEDPLYFSRIFRMVNERSPVQYRRLHKG